MKTVPLEIKNENETQFISRRKRNPFQSLETFDKTPYEKQAKVLQMKQKCLFEKKLKFICFKLIQIN
ncbi:hypothetical protein QR98_0003170 [Sarcoptes scabiei]|uniref:Uncharacterized protein n=1 Tax=Sarcoptes scabiei TaxID=52283 RepID=A0A131ZT24_SARSC|nr:hypothetical protein QR98_0003170 [Sarcoptes scabiei]